MDAQVLCEYHITIAQITSDTNIDHKPNIVMEGMNILHYMLVITSTHPQIFSPGIIEYFDTICNV